MLFQYNNKILIKQKVESSVLTRNSKLPNYEPTRCSSNENGIIRAYAANTNQGIVRDYNEDRVSIILNIVKPQNRQHETWPRCSFFGVYDGHGGSNCADFLRDNLHQFVIQQLISNKLSLFQFDLAKLIRYINNYNEFLEVFKGNLLYCLQKNQIFLGIHMKHQEKVLQLQNNISKNLHFLNSIKEQLKEVVLVRQWLYWLVMFVMLQMQGIAEQYYVEGSINQLCHYQEIINPVMNWKNQEYKKLVGKYIKLNKYKMNNKFWLGLQEYYLDDCLLVELLGISKLNQKDLEESQMLQQQNQNLEVLKFKKIINIQFQQVMVYSIKCLLMKLLTLCLKSQIQTLIYCQIKKKQKFYSQFYIFLISVNEYNIYCSKFILIDEFIRL